MSRFASLTAFCTLILAVTLTNQVSAQVTPGFPPFSAFASHEVDTVDLMNNNVILSVPIMSKPGAIDFGVAANSYMAGAGTWSPSMSFSVNFATGAPFSAAAYGLLAQNPLRISWTTSQPGPTCSDGSQTTWLSGFSFATSDGTVHLIDPTIQLQTADTDSLCHNQSVTATTIDGSGLTVQINSFMNGSARLGIVYLPNGASLAINSITDRYGNSLTQLSGCGSTSCNYQDKMGLTALSMSTPNGITQPRYSWTDVNAGTPHVDQSITNITLKTNFACNGITDLNNSSATAMTTGFSFPDGTSLGFTYEGTPGSAGKYTGRINQITQREGGTVSYTYGGKNNGIDCTYQTAPVLTRTIGTDQTTYTLTHPLISGSSYSAVNTVVDQGGNKTVYTFTGFTSTGAAAAPTAQVLTQIQHYQGSSTLLTTDVYCYNTGFSSCSFTGARTVTVKLPVTSKIIMHKINGMSTTSATEYHYDSYGNVTYVASYGFGATIPTITTTVFFGTCSASCNTSSPTIGAIGSNIYNLQGEVVTTQNGNTVGQTNYTYGTSGSSNGSLLTTYQWTGSLWLSNTTPNAYNSNGSLSKTYDLANNETDYTYSAGDYIGCSACTSFPFPTQISNATNGVYVKSTWYGVGGVKSADTDWNGNTNTYCYNTGANCSGGTADPYWRVLQTIDPYSSTVISTYPTGTSPDTQSSSFTFNSGNSINSTTLTTDGYGRPIRTQTAQSPTASNYDTTSISYSWNSGYSTLNSSQLCSTTLGAGCTTVHASEFDALRRLYTESTTTNETLTHTYTQNDDLAILTPAPPGETSTGKQVQNQYDGLGRVTSSCLISSTVSGNVLCNQSTNTSAHGVLTSISYSSAAGSTTITSTRGQQTRSKTYDAMGRVIQVVTPEGGTTKYIYDTTTGPCFGTSAGDLAEEIDNSGAHVCYYYDDLHRVFQKYTATPSGAISDCHNFNYGDYNITPPSGITSSNVNGRVVNANVQPDCATNSVDEWFSYDKDGRMTDMWEMTPHSTQYYHSVATFYENGTVKTLQLASPSIYTMTYGLEGEGRWNTLTDTTNSKNIVTGATFYPAANPAVVSLKGTDSDSYTYDMNTGNMTQYQFKVNGVTMTGALTWNANGTLKQLAITDGFHAGGTQTCNYNPTLAANTGYDDLTRLVGADCGSGNWGQTFGYDQYDNLTKTVMSGHIGSTWNPGYSSSNNHCTGCTYDSDGNVTGDGNFVYGWDGYGKLQWTATSGTPTCGTSGRCITYDAFGRIVETSNGTTWTERWITQLGETANMSGTTINFAYFAAPGGEMAMVTGSVYSNIHMDWLGSARVLSNSQSHVVNVDQAFSPYGETYSAFGTVSAQSNLFAGMTENFYTGALWDTPNRELSIAAGRWLSPDPANTGWNRYAYVDNNPCNAIDPLGLDTCTLKIRVNNLAGLSNKDLQTLENRIAQIFGATTTTGTSTGDSVAVQFPAGGSTSDAYGASGVLNVLPTTGDNGNTWPAAPHGIISWLNYNTILAQWGANAALAAGTVGAHEMVHEIAGIGDLPYVPGSPNLMSVNDENKNYGLGAELINAYQNPSVTPLISLTPQQVQGLYNDCKKRTTPSSGGAGNIPDFSGMNAWADFVDYLTGLYEHPEDTN